MCSNVVVRWEHLRHSERGEKRVSTRDSSATIKNPATFLSLSVSSHPTASYRPGKIPLLVEPQARRPLILHTPSGGYVSWAALWWKFSPRAAFTRQSFASKKTLIGGVPATSGARWDGKGRRRGSVGCVDGNRTIKLPSIVRVIETRGFGKFARSKELQTITRCKLTFLKDQHYLLSNPIVYRSLSRLSTLSRRRSCSRNKTQFYRGNSEHREKMLFRQVL